MIHKVSTTSLLACCALLVSVAYAFKTSEIEIFQLQQELEKKYGSNIDFYKFLKLPDGKKSTSKQITKNLRKLARKYHPDKNRKYKKLYARLNLATNILADDSRREIYDYYLKNGFPDYDFNKGGFFFKRVQPKTWFILSFIFLVVSFMHFVVLKIQYNSSKRRIENFISMCKEQDPSKGMGETRLVFKQSEDDEGKNLLLKYGDVYVIEPDGTESLVTTETLQQPSVSDTILIRAPKWVWSVTLGRFTSRGTVQQEKKGRKLGTKNE